MNGNILSEVVISQLYSLYFKKMVQAENYFSTYEICLKSMWIWYHIKVE